MLQPPLDQKLFFFGSLSFFLKKSIDVEQKTHNQEKNKDKEKGFETKK